MTAMSGPACIPPPLAGAFYSYSPLKSYKKNDATINCRYFFRLTARHLQL